MGSLVLGPRPTTACACSCDRERNGQADENDSAVPLTPSRRLAWPCGAPTRRHARPTASNSAVASRWERSRKAATQHRELL